MSEEEHTYTYICKSFIKGHCRLGIPCEVQSNKSDGLKFCLMNGTECRWKLKERPQD